MLFKDDYADNDNVWQLFVQDGGEISPKVVQEHEDPTKMTRCPEAAEAHQRAGKGQETAIAV